MRIFPIKLYIHGIGSVAIALQESANNKRFVTVKSFLFRNKKKSTMRLIHAQTKKKYFRIWLLKLSKGQSVCAAARFHEMPCDLILLYDQRKEGPGVSIGFNPAFGFFK